MSLGLNSLFESCFRISPEKVEVLTSSGSNRTYCRMWGGGKTCIGVEGTDPDENRTFCALAGHFRKKGIAVPEVYALSEDGMYYLQEDLGTESLFDCLAAGRNSGEYTSRDISLLRKTISRLPEIQIRGAEDWDFSRCYHTVCFDRRSILFDLNYFKYCFFKTTGIGFNEEKMEDDFQKMADELLSVGDYAFMYRDFQSRNVMIKDDEPYFIDFQGGRKGPLYYDIASFVWQAKSDFPQELKNLLVSDYIAALKEYREVDETEFRSNLSLFVFFRTLQVLGAYGFRGILERKKHFLESIPYAIANLRTLLPEIRDRYPYLNSILSQLVDRPEYSLSRKTGTSAPKPALKVRVFSFSYKKGIPEDESGNGGGYVFDCRAVHNPGKYERYRHSTGMDQDVISFLEKDGEIFPFLKSVFALADAHVERFIERGFTDLMFSFGCTGGQHRSVYSAEALAAHLSEKYGVKVVVEHREQGVKKEF